MICSKCQAPILDDSPYCSKCGTATHSSEDAATVTNVLGPAGELAPGTVLAGKYRILEMVGRGGMGIVYKAEDTKLHRSVALKFLPPDLVHSKESRERFVIEARAAAALSHPNICTIHEIYDQEEWPFIEMEYVEGRSLRARIKEGPLEAGEAVEIAIQAAEALEEAHQKGIVHRDIKSANIMVTAKGQAKVMDFGLAKVKGETLHTREGTTLGTVAYMSPEQAQGQAVDQRTDLWSLGVVLYEMLSGRLPFTGERDTSILYSVVHAEPKPLKEAAPGVPGELSEIVSRALKKDLKARYGSAAEMAADLRRYREGRQAAGLTILRPKVVISAIALLLLLCAGGAWWFHRQSKVRWAREQALPEIERLLLESVGGNLDAAGAYRVAEEAEKYIGGDPRLAALLERCSVRIDLKTEPAGAAIWFRHVSSPDTEWRYLGESPLEKIRLPAGGFLWKIEKQGYETVMAMAPTFRYDANWKHRLAPRNFQRVLDPVGKLPPGMVRVAGGGTGKLPDFFIDKYEVTNRQYKEFIDAGGYRDRKHWKHEFLKEGKKLAWEAALAELVDQSGRPGPSTWSAGEPPAGQDAYPVSGVSWYEAAAYAEFRGKRLPAVYHWGQAAGVGMVPVGWLARASNVGTDGPAVVGSRPGMTAFGAYDMAGNVREWCWNPAKNGRVVRGGAWNDAAYMFSYISQAAPFDRSPRNGFRCALYPDLDRVSDKMFAPWSGEEAPDFYKQRPVADSVFEVYREQFSYDKKPLNARTEWRNESAAGWIQEKVILDAAYGSEQLPVYLFLPRNSRPPYQAVVYFPGTHTTYVSSSKDLDQYYEFVSVSRSS